MGANGQYNFESTAAFRAVFDRLWPMSSPYPLFAPYVGAIATRSQAFAWCLANGVHRDPAVLRGDLTSILTHVGRALTDAAVE